MRRYFPSLIPTVLVAMACLLTVTAAAADKDSDGAKPAQEKKAKLEKKAAVVPSRELNPVEQQQFQTLIRDARLVTKFNSKENKGDSETWYVLGFEDAAMAETKSREATLKPGVVSWSDGNQKQNKVVRDAVIVQGRGAAAVAIIDYLNAGNAAAEELNAPSAQGRPGYLKRQQTQVAVSRRWGAQAFKTQSEAQQFHNQVNPQKK